MNRNIKLLLLSPLLFTSLTSCHAGKYHLTMGTYLEYAINTLDVINVDGLEELRSKSNNVYLLATYQKDYSEDCLCWTTFQNVLVNYINTYHEKVYVFDTMESDATIKNGMHIKQFKDSTPALYVFEGMKCIGSFFQNNQKDKALFEDLTAKTMNERVHQKVLKPVMYEVDDAYLDKNLAQKDEALLFFMRNGCGDCSYVIPNVIIPYTIEYKGDKEILVYDLQNEYEISKSESASEEEKAHYQELKDKYGLSETGNQTYGYLNGVVPTIQHYVKGVIDDATVFFNDVVSEKEDGTYYLSDSYYSEERITNLKYYSGEPLKGMTVTDIAKTKDKYPYWPQNEAAKHHTPILRQFLDYYLL